MGVTYYILKYQGTALNTSIATDLFTQGIKMDPLAILYSYREIKNGPRIDYGCKYQVGLVNINYSAENRNGQIGTGILLVDIISTSSIDSLEAQILKIFERKPDIATLSLQEKKTIET